MAFADAGEDGARGVTPSSCFVVRARGAHRWEDGGIVVSLGALIPTLRRAASVARTSCLHSPWASAALSVTSSRLHLALEQLPQSALDGDILARADSASASHDLADASRESEVRFSFGHRIGEPVHEVLPALPEQAWQPAIDQDDEERERVGRGADGQAQPARLGRGKPADLPQRQPASRRAALLTNRG